MSDDLLQLIFAAALILFGLLGSRKKKPTQQPPRRRPAPAARPAPPPARTARPVPPMRSAAPPAAAPQPRDALLEQLQRMLGGQVEAEPLEEERPEAVSLEATDVEERRQRVEGTSARWAAGLDRGAESLETLEEAGESSHARFHARLQATSAPAAIQEADPAIARLRRAIIWSEILGPPVSMRDGSGWRLAVGSSRPG
jgi:hypothetical protein